MYIVPAKKNLATLWRRRYHAARAFSMFFCVNETRKYVDKEEIKREQHIFIAFMEGLIVFCNIMSFFH
jgi:hypothetical protein